MFVKCSFGIHCIPEKMEGSVPKAEEDCIPEKMEGSVPKAEEDVSVLHHYSQRFRGGNTVL